MFATTPLHAQTAHFSGAQVTLGSGLYAPTGVAVDGSGNVYIADLYGSRVVKVPWTGSGYGTQMPLANVAINGLGYPYAVAVDGSGNVYIADDANSRVVKVPWTGSGYGTLTTVAGDVYDPIGVAVDGSGNVYIADGLNNRVVKVPWTGSGYGTQVTVADAATNGLNWPNGLAVDGSGNVYIGDFMNHRVVKVPWTGSGYGTQSTVESGVNSPFGLAVDGSGNVYVADYDSGSVVKVPWTGSNYGTQVTLADARTNGLNQPYGVALDGGGNVYIVDQGNRRVVKVQTVAADFGTVNVGSPSAATSVLFTFDSGGSLNATTPYQVLTQGAAGLDFAPAATQSSSACVSGHTYNADDSCTVDVVFTPKYAGLRMGAVQLMDSSGSVIATANLHGIGVGPQVVFGPGTQSTAGSGLNLPYGVAVDGSGNVYIADSVNNRVVKVPWTGSGYGTQSTVGSGFYYPMGVAVDGSGNVYIADYGNNRVVKVPWTGYGYGIQSTVGSGLNLPDGVAVDGSGNVYIVDQGSGSVVKVPWTGSGYGTQSTVVSGLDWDWPSGVAVDSSGNVYIAEQDSNRVVKVPWTGSGYGTQSTVVFGVYDPKGVAVDGGGNVYIADNVNCVVRVPWTGRGYGTQRTVGSGLNCSPRGVAVDGSGKVYFGDGQDRVVKVDLADPLSLSFASTAVGSTSSDSPQTVTVSNIGNADLHFPVTGSGNNPSIAQNFTLDSSGAEACPLVDPSSTPGTLAAGASCLLPISLTPTSVGSISGSLALMDDNLNAAGPSYATQTINLSGSATQGSQTIDFAALPSPVTYGVAPITLFATGGASGNPVTFSLVSGPGSVSGSTLTITGAGTVVVAADQTGDSNYTAAPQVTQSITVNGAALTVTADATSKVYGASDSALTYHVTSGGLMNGDSLTGSLSRDSGENVGSYAIRQGTLAAGNNYSLIFIGANLAITQAQATVSPNAASKVYGATDPTLSGTLSGFQASDNVTASYSRAAGETVTGGPYTISATLSPAAVLSNYNVTYNTANFTISKTNASVTPATASKVYGATDPTLSGALSGFQASDNVTASYSRTAGETVAGGPYTISATLNPATVLGNYNVTYNTAAFTINKATASVTPNVASKTYGATDPTLSGTLSGFQASDNVTASYGRTVGETVAGGPYTISATLSPAAALNNYTITYGTANFTISTANASVTPAAVGKTYGAADPMLSGTLSGFQASDNVTASYSRTAGETVAGGPYTISATLNSAAALGNYNVTYNTANFTINQATASVTPNVASKVYGATDPTLSGTLLGFLASDNVTASYSRTAGETADGPYTISARLSPAAALNNYNVTYNAATFTINKATALATLQTSTPAVMLKNNFTLTAKVTSGSGAPTGSVNFMDGTNALGSGTLDNSGTALLTLSTLSAGTHSLTAVYTGDSNFNGITSTALSETVQDFQLVVSGSSGNAAGTVQSVTVLPGGTATYQIQIAPTNGTTFSGAVTLSLSGLPAGASYAITPSGIAAGSGSQTVSVQVQTARPVAGLRTRGAGSPLFAFGLLVPMFGIVQLRRSGAGRTKCVALVCLLLAVAMLGMSACGGGSGSPNQAPQTYTLQLNATSGALQHSTTLNLTIQ